jgi:hypothetical protein
MAEEKRRARAITGRKRVAQRDVAKGGIPHHEGWNAATEDALKKKLKWDPGDYSNVRVEYFAKVHVENPGTITEYSVRLTPGP